MAEESKEEPKEEQNLGVVPPDADADAEAEATASEGGPSIDPNTVLELGDRVLIVKGEDDMTSGIVYYRTGKLLRIKPDGMSRILVDFPRVYDESTGEDSFDPTLNITASYILQKRKSDKFIDQQNYAVGQYIKGYLNDAEVAAYEITGLSEDKDAITVKSTEDENETLDIDFDYTGIPINLPFNILNKTLPPKVEVPTGPTIDATTATEQPSEEDEEVLDNSEAVHRQPDIFVPIYQTYAQVSASEELATDDIQRSDAINDFLNLLPLAAQKEPEALRKYRILVEILYLMKNEIVNYAPDGTVLGAIDPGISTLADLIKMTQTSMGRPVFNIKKRLYRDPTNNEDMPDETMSYIYWKDDMEEQSEFEKYIAPSTKSSVLHVNNEEVITIIKHYERQKEVFKKFEVAWTAVPSEIPGGNQIKITDDIQFFRCHIPDLETTDLPAYDPVNAPLTKYKRDEEVPYPILNVRSYGLEQGLGMTYRKGKKGGKELLLGAEVVGAELKSYLLFPFGAARWMGSKRSGSLALDTGRSLEKAHSIDWILETLDGIPEVMTAKNIVALKVEANVMDNYNLSEYLEGIPLKGTGIGDLMIPLEDYGISRHELTEAVFTVLLRKITIFQAQLKRALEADRTRTLGLLPPEPNPFLPLDNPILRSDEPVLKAAIEIFRRQNPTLRDSDVALFTYMITKYSDFFQASIGGQPNIITKQRLQNIQDRVLQQREIERILVSLRDYDGLVPVPNPCEHVARLVAIRRMRNEDSRMYFLTKFLSKYQGRRREDNWISCSVCDKELLCVHERLNIQAYLNPTEKDTIRKDLCLHFSGGVFQGHYICRSCGQPIQELGYDTHVTFDDEGRPMQSSVALIDEEALTKKEIEDLLTVPLKDEEQLQTKTPLQIRYLLILKDIAEGAGLALPRSIYEQLLKFMEANIVVAIPPLEQYTADHKAKEEKAGKKGRMLPYNIFVNRYTVACAAAYILIEAQTALKEYRIYGTHVDCVAGFGGYPLTASDEDKEGIKFLACTIVSVKKDAEPWKSLYEKENTDEKRIDLMMKYMTIIINKIIKNSLIFEQKYILRRQRQTDAVVDEKGLTDTIYPTFLPRQRPEKIVAAEGAAVPEVAAAQGNIRHLTLSWILEANRLTAANTTVIRDSPFSTLTCCKTSLNTPTAFWNQEALPKIPGRGLQTRKLPSLQVHFTPRTTDIPPSDLKPAQLYPLFLKVCYEGPHKGQLHEPGPTHKCIWCGFDFGIPYSIMTDEEAAQVVSKNPEVNTDMDHFQDLLDTVHTVNKIEMPRPTYRDVLPETYTEFGAMDPPPIEEWTEFYTDIMNRLLPTVTDIAEIATILQPLFEKVEEIRAELFARYAEPLRSILTAILKLKWSNFIQVLEAYFIKPCSQILNDFNGRPTISEYDGRKFSPEHKDDIKKFLVVDDEIVTKFMDSLKNYPDNAFARSKMAYFVKQCSQIIKFKHRINETYFVGRSTTFNVFQQAFLFGPLETLLDVNAIPPDYTGTTEVGNIPATDTLPKYIAFTLRHFSARQMTYDDEQVKQIIADKAEREKQGILKMLTGLGDEERAAMKMNMRLKLGRFAVGANWKTIAQYSANEYDRRKQEILETENILGFTGAPAGRTAEQSGYDNADHFGENND